MKDKTQKVLNIDEVITKFKSHDESITKKFPINEEEIAILCHLFKSVLITQPMLLELDPPLVVCGDIHGQYKDLTSIFSRLGQPHDCNYLFLGDYVDRGKKSLECICLLMAYKIKYPLNFFLLRGNHQCASLNKIYGFFDQCKRKCSIRLWKIITDTFDFLPAAAIIANRIFCVHGGLSPALKQLQELNNIKRPIVTSESRIITDLLWSDPNHKTEGWEFNFERGVSCCYGKNTVNEFVKKHNFDFICRSHQVVEEGYEFFNDRKLLTIFSAPNYCGEFQNLGGVLKVSTNLVCSIEQFKVPFLGVGGKVKRTATPIKTEPGKENKHDHNKDPEGRGVFQSKRRPTRDVSTLHALLQQQQTMKMQLVKNQQPL